VFNPPWFPVPDSSKPSGEFLSSHDSDGDSIVLPVASSTSVGGGDVSSTEWVADDAVVVPSESSEQSNTNHTSPQTHTAEPHRAVSGLEEAHAESSQPTTSDDVPPTRQLFDEATEVIETEQTDAVQFEESASEAVGAFSARAEELTDGGHWLEAASYRDVGLMSRFFDDAHRALRVGGEVCVVYVAPPSMFCAAVWLCVCVCACVCTRTSPCAWHQVLQLRRTCWP
jgi:hypothetical protein